MELTPHEYYSMTRAEFFIKAEGFKNKDTKLWEKVRFIGYQTYAHAPFRKKRPVRITKFLPLESDKKDLGLSDRQMKERWQRAKNNESKVNRTS